MDLHITTYIKCSPHALVSHREDVARVSHDRSIEKDFYRMIGQNKKLDEIIFGKLRSLLVANT
jgi:hypothetical protein